MRRRQSAKTVKTVMSSGLSPRARVTWRHMCDVRDWKVEKGFEPSDGTTELALDLIVWMAESENLKTFSTICGGSAAASPLEDALGSFGEARSSFTRVSRAFARSRKGWVEMVSAPRQISAHELMKCHVAVPSRTA